MTQQRFSHQILVTTSGYCQNQRNIQAGMSVHACGPSTSSCTPLVNYGAEASSAYVCDIGHAWLPYVTTEWQRCFTRLGGRSQGVWLPAMQHSSPKASLQTYPNAVRQKGRQKHSLHFQYLSLPNLLSFLSLLQHRYAKLKTIPSNP